MNDRYSKTEVGRAELKAGTRGLPRPTRNVLFVIDPTRPAQEWLSQIQGTSSADLEHLLRHGLIERVAAPDNFGSQTAPLRPTQSTFGQQTAPMRAARDFDDLTSSLGYERLYDVLTSQSKERLGLIKGYRMILEVERCTDISELRLLANRFADQLREEQGEDAVRKFRSALVQAAKP